ncbi:MAG: response regulator transcription factor [Lachnospiraceae bacterium]|nr:response regulator transcription factor [Lachnospiraceae bacterium]
MRVAIIDDEITQQEILEKYLREWAEGEKTLIEVNRFDNAESFWFVWEEDKEYDLILLDIEMGQINGLELAKKIRTEDEQVPIMFVTGYDEYMQYGYDVSALHYLIKPVNKAKFFIILDKLREKKGPAEKILLSAAEGPKSVMPDKIVYAEANGHGCIVHTTSEVIAVKESIGTFERIVSTQSCFVKCHRAYIVNLQYVSMVLKTDVVLDSDERIPVSRNRLKSLQEAFVKFYRAN